MTLLALFACVDASLTKNDAVPTVTFLSPADGAGFEPTEPLALCVQVDDEKSLDQLDLALYSDVDGLLWEGDGTVPEGCAGGNLALGVTLSEWPHTLTLSATDPSGQLGEGAVSVVPTANRAPSCVIDAPLDGDTFLVGDPMPFAATATDPDTDAAGLGAVLQSDLDGVLWEGSPDSSGAIEVPDLDLGAGEHFLSLTVTDPRGLVDVCAVELTVNGCVDVDQDGVTTCDGDCDDDDATAFPGAPEEADGVDDDCDGVVDDGTLLGDDDDDGWTEVDGDCDDADATVNPGAPETWYDGVDQDCDGEDDDRDGDGFGTAEDCDDLDATANPAAAEVWYDGVDQDCDGDDDDQDGDGYALADDCDDTDPTRSPAAAEAWYDGIDQDCDGRDDDRDGDGYGHADDCDDLDATVNPGAVETWYDGTDQDCDGRDDDRDADGYGVADDCDDTDAAVNPGEPEAWYDGVDQDCDGRDDDQDDDGYALADDCDDTVPTVNPGATETWYDGVDQDCDGRDDDRDGDGYAFADDCDDDDATVNPGATETWYDGVDQDCDGKDDDRDDDGFGVARDCDDDDATVYPSAVEVWYDGVDQDCDGNDDDQDEDGWALVDDCDDTDADVNPGATEAWYDGVDQDCDGNDDDQDEDGYALVDDCDDEDATTYPGGSELRDAADNDCDDLCDEGLLSEGDLIVSEFMKDPSVVGDTEGEWVEVYNTTSIDIAMCNWTMEDLDGESVTIDGVLVPAGGYAVLARNATSSTNGGVTADVGYGNGFQLGNSGDEIVLYNDTTELDRVVYTSGWTGTSGRSYTLDPTLLDGTSNDSFGSWCKGSSAIRSTSSTDYGTPGAANDGC